MINDKEKYTCFYLLLNITWGLTVPRTLAALAANTAQNNFLEQSLFPDFQFLQEV